MMNFKNIFKSAALLLVFGGSLTACSDMLETESTRQMIDPSIEQKTDSVFYAFGILQALQDVADQYVFQGEMRGDLVKTTKYTDNNLRQLADFTADQTNKYDSAYVYYKVINNCNYYIAHCDTNLYRGSTNVIIDKYAAAKAIRAWAYLQLGRNYERVPFYTTPLTAISQIDNGDFPELTLSQLVAELAPDLEQYSGMVTPSLGSVATADGYSYFEVGTPNWANAQKRVSPHYMFVPIDVVLGDMYLETEQFDAAAKHYITYLTKVATRVNSNYIAPPASKTINTGRFGYSSDDDLPNSSLVKIIPLGQGSWSDIFSQNSMRDLVTYIPMAVSRENGGVTNVPLTFGFNYYATTEETARLGTLREPYVEEIQLLPSDVLNQLSDSTEYYYYAAYTGQSNNYDSISSAKCGDMRLRSILQQAVVEDSVMQWIDKYKYANIILYRKATVLLRLAEAFNRLEMPDVAFAILKDGISDGLLAKNNFDEYYVKYLTEESRQKLQTTYPLLSEANIAKFPIETACGIHCHGAGRAAGDFAYSLTNAAKTPSPYQLDRMAGLKMKELETVYGLTIGATKQDTINAVEDLICDELALETAFEGNRYYDLLRLARHKNANSPAGYPAQFGYVWLQKKLGDRWNPSKMYLPFN